jgi:hypothetical protein
MATAVNLAVAVSGAMPTFDARRGASICEPTIALVPFAVEH